MAITDTSAGITRIEKTAIGIVQFWSALNLQFTVSEKGNIQKSADNTFLIVTDEDGKTYKVYIYNLVLIQSVEAGDKPYDPVDKLAGALSFGNIQEKVNEVYDYLTERIFNVCCSSGGDGENTMNYIVNVDGVEVDSFSYPSSEDVTITINWI